MRQYVADGRLTLRQIDSAEFSPGQFTNLVMRAVEDAGAGSWSSTASAATSTRCRRSGSLSAHLHELLTYLSHRNVVTMLTLAQHGLIGEHVPSPVDISYLADTVLLLRYFEASGRHPPGHLGA